jgi:hypothetical protein
LRCVGGWIAGCDAGSRGLGFGLELGQDPSSLNIVISAVGSSSSRYGDDFEALRQWGPVNDKDNC